MTLISWEKFVAKWENVNVVALLTITLIEWLFIDRRVKLKKEKISYSSLEESLEAEVGQKTSNERKLNTYDLLKAVGILFNLSDHLGWCGVVKEWRSRSITRAIGRGSAPVFFFLIGISGSYRFRWQIWAWATYTLLAKGIFQLYTVESTWCSMASILCMNFIMRYFPLKYLKEYPIIICLLLTFAYSTDDFLNNVLHIPYGGVVFALPFCGYLVHETKYPGIFSTLAVMAYHTYDSIKGFCSFNVWGTNSIQIDKYVIYLVCGVMAFWFAYFKTIDLPNLPLPIENLIRILSNNACVIFHFHLALFRLWGQSA
jgi:hypothetical protein